MPLAVSPKYYEKNIIIEDMKNPTENTLLRKLSTPYEEYFLHHTAFLTIALVVNRIGDAHIILHKE